MPSHVDTVWCWRVQVSLELRQDSSQRPHHRNRCPLEKLLLVVDELEPEACVDPDELPTLHDHRECFTEAETFRPVDTQSAVTAPSRDLRQR